MTDIRMEFEKEVALNSVSTILCGVCNKHFKTKSMLKQHFQSVHEKIKYSCNICEYQATTKGSLKKHIHSVHEKIKYPCNLCEYQATRRGSLKNHIQSVHEKIRRSNGSITK